MQMFKFFSRFSLTLLHRKRSLAIKYFKKSMTQDLTDQTFYGCCAILQLLVNTYAAVLITLTEYYKYFSALL